MHFQQMISFTLIIMSLGHLMQQPTHALHETSISRVVLEFPSFVVPHHYEVSSTALPEIKAMGADFIGIHMLPDQFYFSQPAPGWINCAPYRVNRYGMAVSDSRPVYYGGNVTLNSNQFFNCLTEIRDDGGYEWYPDDSIFFNICEGNQTFETITQQYGTPSLFTHEYFFENISIANWREIIHEITSSISLYHPKYTSTDYAIQYIRARKSIKITDVQIIFHQLI